MLARRLPVALRLVVVLLVLVTVAALGPAGPAPAAVYPLTEVDAAAPPAVWSDGTGKAYTAWLDHGDWPYNWYRLRIARVLADGSNDPSYPLKDIPVGLSVTYGYDDCGAPGFTSTGQIVVPCDLTTVEESQQVPAPGTQLHPVEVWSTSGTRISRQLVSAPADQIPFSDLSTADGRVAWISEQGRVVLMGSAGAATVVETGIDLEPGDRVESAQLPGGPLYLLAVFGETSFRVLRIEGTSVTLNTAVACTGDGYLAAVLPGTGSAWGYACAVEVSRTTVTYRGTTTWSRTVDGCGSYDSGAINGQGAIVLPCIRGDSTGTDLAVVPASGTIRRSPTLPMTWFYDTRTVLVDDDTAVVAGTVYFTGGSADRHVHVLSVPPPQKPATAPGVPVISNVRRDGFDVTVPAVAGYEPTDRGDAPTGYRVFLYKGTSTTPVQTKDAGTATRKVSFSGLDGPLPYRVRAAAFNSGGQGPSSAYTGYVLPPFTSLDAFTNRQYLDFAGRNATTAEKASWSGQVVAGTAPAENLANGAVDFSYHQKQSPIIRLFRAYFLRLPDKSGLDYWTGRHRGGTTLDAISGSFASSGEFKAKYGSLTNRGFVELVYQNVLGRPGDAAGVAYWAGHLDTGAKTRGQVMVGFSESAEYRNKTRAVVNAVNVFTGMLRRVPTTTELATWAPAANVPTRLSLVRTILRSAEYDTRV